MTFAQLAQKAADLAPQTCPPDYKGGFVLIDADVLCYEAAYKHLPVPGALDFCMDKIDHFKAVTGGKALLFLTPAGSDKGGRYASSVLKPYQGNRTDKVKPTTFSAIYQGLEQQTRHTVHAVKTAEADDLIAAASYRLDGRCAIASADKDLRSVPGLHLDWGGHYMTVVKPDDFAVYANDKCYGEKYFWLQMLQGDIADNVCGLPYLVDGKVKRKVGPVLAGRMLAGVKSRADAFECVYGAYRTCFTANVSPELAFCSNAHALWLQHTGYFMDFQTAIPARLLGNFELALGELAARVQNAREINAQT